MTNQSKFNRVAGKSAAGKVIAITGGANGIGREIAHLLATEGALVAIGDLDGDAVKRTAQELDGTVLGLDLDVTDTESFAAFLTEVETRWGPVDILVNNAGVMWVGPYDQEPHTAAERQIAVNLFGVINGVKLSAPAMVARGSGHIITIASAASILTTPGEATYATSKHGVYGYLKAVREELRRSPVQISMIMPAVVNTALAAGTGTGVSKLLQPQDVAAVVLRTIEKPRFEVSLPGYVDPLLRVVNVLPRQIRELLSRRLVPDQVKQVDSSARAGYEEQFREKK